MDETFLAKCVKNATSIHVAIPRIIYEKLEIKVGDIIRVSIRKDNE